jgi:hypothetical protein
MTRLKTISESIHVAFDIHFPSLAEAENPTRVSQKIRDI